jgi:hypothetical protein
MFEPLTPTIKRKSSLKKILISSPSQEIVRFLNLPNPAANEDPRSRIHILTPKSKSRSLSKSDLYQPKTCFETREATNPFNRDCFIRKRNPQTSWKKSIVPFRSNKLQIKNSEERIISSQCYSEVNKNISVQKKLDFTFGNQEFWNCIKVWGEIKLWLFIYFYAFTYFSVIFTIKQEFEIKLAV